MQFGLLGPLTVRRDGAEVLVTVGKQRAVLAALLLEPDRVVTIDHLARALWGAEPPPSARVSVQNYVMRLRKALGPAGEALIVTRPGGYLIRAGANDLDVPRFEALVAAAHAATRHSRWAEAAGHARGALALWRGEPLADAGSKVLAAREGPRLGELRLQAIEARTEAEVYLGRPGEVVAELRHLTGDYPLRERLHGLLMLALYRDGRQAEALAAYQVARNVLIGELGTEPGAALSGLHQRILTADPALAATAHPVDSAPRAMPVRYSLPPDTLAFTGRDAELAAIAAAAGATTDGIVAIQAIGGMPGAGKTALAVRAAHLLADRFPDRQLFVSLHGHTPGRDPVAPEDALAGLLAATGLDPRYLPVSLDGRAALWRDRMAGKRALLVLDNAASSTQVAPLLAGTGRAGAGSCLVLVTSRRHLGDLPGPVVPVLVDALPPRQAVQMFIRLAPRAAAYPDAVTEIIRLTGYLPLAISLLARVFQRHPSWSPGDLATETRARLLALRAEDDSIAAAFEVSYRRLDPAAQRLFRLLALHLGTTADAYSAAALAGTSPEEAGGLLDVLHAEGLVTETAYRRYGMHDLLRRYASDRAACSPVAEAAQALGRLADYYQHTAARSQALVSSQARPGRPRAASAEPPPAATPFGDAKQALAWARAERAGLLACLDDAARQGHDARVIALTAGVAELLRRDGPWTDAITRQEAAVAAARRLRDRVAEAGALSDLGGARRLAGDYPAATQDLEQALGICRDLGDQPGMASILTSLGTVHQLRNDYVAAIRDFGQALAIGRDLGDRLGEASALTGLGYVRRLTGEALAAIGDLEHALVIFRDFGSRIGEGNALVGLAFLRQDAGDYAAAARDLEQALVICRGLGNRLGEGTTLLGLGSVRRLTGDYPAAIRDLERVLAICRDLGDRLGEANALCGLGGVHRLTSDNPAAALALDQAWSIYRDLGDRGGQAEALNERGELYRAEGDFAAADRCHQQAIELARAIGAPWVEASALAGLGRCALAVGLPAGGTALLGRALEIYRRIGAAEASGLRAELNALHGRSAGRPGRT
jgi:DNA-binding SARP family transcriptional activator/tetratricopeptide (TPR) repeat protein